MDVKKQTNPMKQYFGVVHSETINGVQEVWLRDDQITITPVHILKDFEGRYVKVTVEPINEAGINKILLSDMRNMLSKNGG